MSGEFWPATAHEIAWLHAATFHECFMRLSIGFRFQIGPAARHFSGEINFSAFGHFHSMCAWIERPMSDHDSEVHQQHLFTISGCVEYLRVRYLYLVLMCALHELERVSRWQQQHDTHTNIDDTSRTVSIAVCIINSPQFTNWIAQVNRNRSRKRNRNEKSTDQYQQPNEIRLISIAAYVNILFNYGSRFRA